MLLEPRRMKIITVVGTIDGQSCVAPELGPKAGAVADPDDVGDVIAELVDVAVGIFLVNAVGILADVDEGADARVPGVTMTA